MPSHVVLLAGGTASGKTTITAALMQRVKRFLPALVPVDSYYYPLTHLTMEERDQVNFDHPQQFEISLLVNHVRALAGGENVSIPVYNYSIHDREPDGHKVQSSALIFVEGIMALHYPELCEIADYKIFVETPDELRLERRIARDIAERGRTKESVLHWWDERVHPMHLEFCGPSKERADLTVSGTIDVDEAVEAIIQAMQKRRLLPDESL